MSQEYPKFQAIMTKAYEGYKSSMTYKDFLRSLDDKTAGIVALGNLNYQVENGGFIQWHFNGYHKSLPHLQNFLETLGTEEATKVNRWASWVTRQMTYAQEDYSPSFDQYDTKYYAIAETLLAQVEASL